MNQVNTKPMPKILNANTQPSWYHSSSMTDDEKPRSIRFPQRLWDAIDRDAVRCKRSAVKQMEAVLSEYYALAAVELDRESLETMRSKGARTATVSFGQKEQGKVRKAK